MKPDAAIRLSEKSLDEEKSLKDHWMNVVCLMEFKKDDVNKSTRIEISTLACLWQALKT